MDSIERVIDHFVDFYKVKLAKKWFNSVAHFSLLAKTNIKNKILQLFK